MIPSFRRSTGSPEPAISTVGEESSVWVVVWSLSKLMRLLMSRLSHLSRSAWIVREGRGPLVHWDLW